MAARLGNVIYYLGWFIAVPAAVFAALMFFFWYREPSLTELGLSSTNYVDLKTMLLSWALLSTGVSAGSWVIGRVSLYVLAGR